MTLPELALGNPRFTGIAVALGAGLGLVSFLTMPRSEDPVFDVPASTIVAVLPGADAADLESLVVDPVEEELRALDDVDRVQSTMDDGLARISVDMVVGTDPDDGYDRVLQAVNRIRADLPAELRTLDVFQVSLTDVSVLQIALRAHDDDLERVRRPADLLERRLERVPGVKTVDVWALADREVRVAVDPVRLDTHGVGWEEVAGALRGAGLDLPGGSVDAGARRFNVRTTGELGSLAAIREVVVAGRGTQQVRVGDVAEVFETREDDRHRIRVSGRPAVLVSATQRDGTNVMDVVAALQGELAAFRASLPEGVEVVPLFDQSVSVDARVGGFFTSLLQGVALVGAIMIVFLGWRPAVLVVMTIPLAVLLALAGVDAGGFGLQQMSIVGLVIALGLLVDDAIVVVENVARHRRLGRSPLEAALEGAVEVAGPSTSGTVTTVLAFVPMIAMPTTTGDYIRSLPVTVVYALLASLLLSLTLTPWLASRLLSRRAGAPPDAPSPTPDPASPARHGDRLTGMAAGPYRRALDAALRHPARVLGGATLALAVSLVLFPLVGVSLFPAAEKPQFLISVETPAGTSLEGTDAVVRQVEGLAARLDGVERVVGNTGRDHPQVYYNVVPRQETSNVGQVFVETTAFADHGRVIPMLRDSLGRVPGARFTVVEFENGPPVEAPVVFRVVGDEIGELTRLSRRVEAILRATPGARDVRNALGERRTDLALRVDPGRLHLTGLDPASLDRTVRAHLAGTPVTTWRDARGEELDVVVRMPTPGARPTPDDLERIRLRTRTGALVPLAQVARVELVEATGVLEHFDGERVATVTARVDPDVSALDVTRAAREALESEPWPDGYRWFAGGVFEEQQEGFAGMLRALLVAVFGIFAVLVLQFRSFVQPVVILAAVPLAFVGAVLALLVTGYTFSFTAFIGITSLAGIVINNAILLVEFANRARGEGADVVQALARAGEARFSPIVLTTLTTIGGLLPLTLTGSSLWSPLGWVIIGGLLVSTVLTLFVVPVLYRLVEGPGAATSATVS